ncbi:hypothetical protein [Intestinibacter bartlettii]|uniref:Uncharacterized protein n=1 Tax=Intestinibacter bartlettii TaxID=261299 RepID=A0ABS6DYG2_9FIRM|nr:hypothetical protein [Intestinibacter bartlettii]MBU5336584.1 hypothetical protein [Intestinibacter bartlettii]
MGDKDPWASNFEEIENTIVNSDSPEANNFNTVDLNEGFNPITLNYSNEDEE